MKRRSERGSSDVTTYIVLGGIIGIVTDMAYYSLKMPGSNTRLNTCERLTRGDVYQIAAESLLVILSLYSNSYRLQGFTNGMLFGGLIPKINALNGSRYLLYDLSDDGAIVPVAQLPDLFGGK